MADKSFQVKQDSV